MSALGPARFSGPLLGVEEVVDRALSAIADSAPFSLIRLGDGEAVVLSVGENLWLQDLAYLHGHWGAERVSLGSIELVRNDLIEAVAGADIVGVRDDIVDVAAPSGLLESTGADLRKNVIDAFNLRPDEVARLSTIGARRLALLQRAITDFEWDKGQSFCSAWVHWDLLETGGLAALVREAPRVALVTSRPQLETLVARTFDIEVISVIVPDKFVDAPQPGAHVPDRYQDIRPELSFPKGTLVLVGAGIPGKAYCQWAKEAGCIAVDVGSVFDAWIGKPSRPRVLESRFRVADGASVPDHLQLSTPIDVGERRLVPRWKPSKVAP